MWRAKRKDSKSQKDGSRNEESEEEKGNNRSFADVVSGGYKKDKMENIGEVIETFWDGDKNNVSWLSKCAVGTLKRIDKVFRTNQRLVSRGYVFKASYLGEKFILWRFDSESACKSFINNRPLWEDNFSVMEEWSSKVVVEARPMWVNFLGVPMSYWNSEFFFQIGSKIGDPLLIDDETILKKKKIYLWGE